MTKKQTRNSLTSKGVGYHKVRSKYLKGPDGYGRVISVDRERLLARLKGKDPGKDVVVQHKKPGPHLSKTGEPFKIGTRGENTAESNRLRARLRKRRHAKATR